MPENNLAVSGRLAPKPLFGHSWQDAAWRAGVVFVLGYMLPRVWAGQAVSGLQWPASLVCFGLAALAVLRYLQAQDQAIDAEDEAVVLLSDDKARAGTLDDVVSARAAQPKAKPREWSLEVLHALEWRRMTDVCLAFYKERGLLSGAAQVSRDGSVDVRLYQGPSMDEALPPFALLHCKARGEPLVGVAAIERLQAEMAEAGVNRAFFMGAWGFDEAAQAAAKALQITLVDDRMFLSMIGRLSAEERQRLLNLAVEGDYSTPSCPACGLKMIPRQSEQGRYWGCRAFPRCKNTLGMQA